MTWGHVDGTGTWGDGWGADSGATSDDVYGGTLDPADFDPGDYSFTVHALDEAGNETISETHTFSVPGTLPITDRPQIVVQIAFGQAPFSTSLVWTDVTKDILFESGVSIVRGAPADSPQPTAGTVSYTLRDFTRKYDPLNTASPYYGKLTPQSPTRVRAIFGSTTYPLGYGYVDSFPQTYSNQADNYTTIDISAPDALSVLARTSFRPKKPFTIVGGSLVNDDSGASYHKLDSGAVLADPVPALELDRSGGRVLTLLQRAGIGATYLNIDRGRTAVEPEKPSETNLLDHIRKITATEYGRFYQAADGTLRFVARRPVDSTTPQAIFAEADVHGAIPYAEITFDPADRRFLVNRCVRSSQSTPTATVQDQTSIDDRGTFEDSQTLAFADAQDTNDQAAWIVTRFKDAQPRATAMVIKPDRDINGMFPAVLGCDVGTAYTFRRTPLGIGAPFTQVVTAEQLKHQINTRSWMLSLDLGAADPESYFKLNDPTLGKLDSANLVAY